MKEIKAYIRPNMMDEVVECILEHARTGNGHVGDGKIFVTEIRSAIRIRDGNRGSGIA